MGVARRASISTRKRFEILNRDGFRCRYCGRTADQVKLHVDHVTPVALGGPSDDTNLVTACADCNLGKAARPLTAPIPGAAQRLCGICQLAPATHVHLIPYASLPCDATLACTACDPGGYFIPLSEWDDPRERLDWRRHLVDSKTDGHQLIRLIVKAVGE